MRLAARRPGAPLTALLSLLVLWMGARVVLWESPFTTRPILPPLVETIAEPRMAMVSVERTVEAEIPGMANSGLELLAAAVHQAGRPQGSINRAELLEAKPFPTLIASVPTRPAAGGHGPDPGTRDFVTPGITPAPARTNRWSLDAWALVRGNGGGMRADGPILATYGASQAGAVLRYRLSEGTRRPTHAYMRINTALGDRRERDAALGLAVRPLAGLPVALLGEARLSQNSAGTTARPGVMVVSEFPPVGLGAGTRAEAYVQAGYVGGPDATGFADGQARVVHDLAVGRRVSLSAGVGAWGGLQSGAERVDIGPTATLDLRIGEAAARLAIDYRFRAAGDAMPQSGPAITLSTGF